MTNDYVVLGPDGTPQLNQWVVLRTFKDEGVKGPYLAACPTREAAEAALRLLKMG